MIPRCRILVSFQNPPGPFLKEETKLFLCLFDLNFDFASKYDSFVFFCLGREARMQWLNTLLRDNYLTTAYDAQHKSLLFKFYYFAFYGC